MTNFIVVSSSGTRNCKRCGVIVPITPSLPNDGFCISCRIAVYDATHGISKETIGE